MTRRTGSTLTGAWLSGRSSHRAIAVAVAAVSWFAVSRSVTEPAGVAVVFAGCHAGLARCHAGLTGLSGCTRYAVGARGGAILCARTPAREAALGGSCCVHRRLVLLACSQLRSAGGSARRDDPPRRAPA